MTETPQRFVIVASQRTGSTMLVRMLDRHPEIRCHGELFRPESMQDVSYRAYLLRSKRFPKLPAPAYVRDFLSELEKDQGAKRVGFKVMYNHLPRNPELAWWIAVNRTPIIHIVRTDLLKTHVSALAAKQRDMWHAAVTPDDHIMITVPLDNLLHNLRTRRRRVEWARRILTTQNSVEVRYEDLVSDPERESERLLGFLGVDTSIGLHPTTSKLNPNNLESIVGNLAEVTSLLRKARFEWIID